MQDTLLWENQNPSVGFAAQKITLDLSKYKTITIVHIPAMSYPKLTLTQKFLRTSDGFSEGFQHLLNASLMNVILWRYFDIDNTGITFVGGLMNNGTVNDDACVPLRIYGS